MDGKIRRKNMTFSIEDIKERLPHRYPFLMVDRIIEQKPGWCKGIKCVTINECHFMGHFPQQSIMPGMLIAESLAQTAAFVGLSSSNTETAEKIQIKKGFLISMDIKFHQPVIPGDCLVTEVKVIKTMGKMTMFHGEAKVDNAIVAAGDFVTAIVD